MDLVVDANAIFAALIKEGTSFELFFIEDVHLFTPEYVLSELAEHRDEILRKTERTPEEFEQLLDVLRRRITIVPLEELTAFVKPAENITPDPDDLAYIALALKLKCAIWSNDRILKEKQNAIHVYTTQELVKLFL